MPPAIVEILLEARARLVAEPAPVTPTVAKIMGAPAHTFREWAVDHAGDFRLAG